MNKDKEGEERQRVGRVRLPFTFKRDKSKVRSREQVVKKVEQEID